MFSLDVFIEESLRAKFAAFAASVSHCCTKRNLLLASASHDMLRVEQERLVVRLPKRQKDWLKQRATEFKTISDVVRDLIDREIESTAKTVNSDCQ